jgi:hypothetical protein
MPFSMTTYFAGVGTVVGALALGFGGAVVLTNTATKGQMTGMLGTYLAAAELTHRGLVVWVTTRNARGADLLATVSQPLASLHLRHSTRSFTVSQFFMPAAMRSCPAFLMASDRFNPGGNFLVCARASAAPAAQS